MNKPFNLRETKVEETHNIRVIKNIKFSCRI